MAIKDVMTWVPDKSRWQKVYRGKTYRVTCHALGTTPTKEASYQAANAWWRSKQIEVDRGRPLAPVIEDLQRRRDWSRQQGEHGQAADHQAMVDEVVGWQPTDVRVDLAAGTVSLPTSQTWEKIARPSPEVWADRLARDRPDVTVGDQTIAGQIRRRLDQLQARVHAGGLSPGSFANTRDCLHHFRDWIGGSSPTTRITADTLEDFHGFLLLKVAERRNDPLGKAGWSRDFALKVFGQAKTFIGHVAGKGLIACPPNIAGKFPFGSGVKRITTMSDDEVRTLVSEATGQLRLHLLLMINCGMTQVDIADLKEEEVDWTAGTITRKRSKTADEATAPVVCYRLWTETFQALKEHRSGKPNVLLTKSGGLWAWEELDKSGKLSSSDNIATNYNRLRTKLNITKSLEIFRKTSATKIEGSPYRHFRALFLGHAPQGIGERHYADHSQPSLTGQLPGFGRSTRSDGWLWAGTSK